jgi:aspartyl-tRNA(Asn)/glutamyl-tRNA(Gln) amidotransferase subunit C
MVIKLFSTVNVKHLAELASLKLNQSEAQKLAKQFLDTLKVVKKLESLDTTTVTATPQVTGQINIFRDDQVDKSRLLTQAEALNNASRSYQGFFVVPAIFEH